MSAESLPSPQRRELIIDCIGGLATKTSGPDPELYVMVYLTATSEKMAIEDWRHLRNMAAVQYELITNPETADNEHQQILKGIETALQPQLTRLHNFKDGWHYRSPAFQAALEDVVTLQQKHYRHDRPSKKAMQKYANHRN